MEVTACFSTSSAMPNALAIRNVLQTVVRDDDEGVDLIGQGGDSGLCLLHAVCTLELEGLRHDTDGQDAGLMCEIRNDRGCARAGATAHTGGDEDHVCALEALGDGRAALLGGLLADVGLGACAHAARQLLTDLQLVIALGLIEILTIRVHNDEFDSADAAGDHPVDNVVAGAADTDHFDIYDLICVSFRH